ncbi:MAG: AMP-binding protein, partial [Bauldia sp.]|nr:AMP-binding protein [Bauldia sp.]
MPEPAKPFMDVFGRGVLSYGDMLADTARLANALVEAGVEPGDRVAAQVAKSPEAILLYLGCVRAGAAFLPLNTGYTLSELGYFFGDAEPRLIVCDPEMAKDIRSVAPTTTVETLDAAGQGSLTRRAAQLSPDFADAARGPDDLAAILYTSGTTGRSKGAMLTHENLASNARTLVDYWRFTGEDVLIHALPVFHTHGLFVAT